MFKKYNQLIIGFLLGALLFSIVPVSATIQEYLLQKSSAKLIVNGKEFSNKDLPVLNHKGYNYIPAATFREICNTIGVSFEWVGGKKEIQIDTNKKPIVETIEKPVGERQVNNVEDVISKKATVYKKDGYDIFVVDGIEYVSLIGICEKYYERYNFKSAEGSSSANRSMVFVNEVSNERLLDIPHEQIYVFENRMHLRYEYFLNNVLPLINQ
ncbi:hypothetical protein EV204_105195 [Tissierella praeacuta]|uniref:hypothetical protein n=1 Tax=Tissierella praeacuta TaxID=43131 RepID=UPI0010429EBE|nr:hypothetical protein [Tissierella praeacuta]TCU72859.1 hypothetical protein EV204_105195 [Tissierella praeacuta]